MFESLRDPLRILSRKLRQLKRLTALEATILVGKRRNVIDLSEKVFADMTKIIARFNNFYATLSHEMYANLTEDERSVLFAGIRQLTNAYQGIITEFKSDAETLKTWLVSGQNALVKAYLDD